MKKLFLIVTVLISFFAVAQSPQDEIDQQIWVPFTKAWESNDAKAFNAIHTKDVWRVNSGRLLFGSEYKDANEKRMGSSTNTSRTIEFWFEHRVLSGNRAYEVGYYRSTDLSNSAPQYYYGRFHVSLEKVDGVWKITLDWDTADVNGRAVDAAEFAKGKPIHFE